MKIKYDTNKIRPGIGFIVNNKEEVEQVYNILLRYSKSDDEIKLNQFRLNMLPFVITYRNKSHQLGGRIISWYEKLEHCKKDGYKIIEL